MNRIDEYQMGGYDRETNRLTVTNEMTLEPKQWIVYMIQTSVGTLYTGITNDLDKRLSAHRDQKRGARYFNLTNPDKVVFSESHPNRSEASKREAAIKKMSRQEKLLLIEVTKS